MWPGKGTPNPLCYNELQFSDRKYDYTKPFNLTYRSNRDRSLSPDLPPVDSAHVPTTVKLKKVASEGFNENPFFTCRPTQHTLPPAQTVPKYPSSDSMSTHRSTASFVYRTRAPRRGTCLIISVDSFKPALCLPGRPGADVDLQKLESTFRMLDFDVKTYQNPSASDISNIIETGE